MLTRAQMLKRAHDEYEKSVKKAAELRDERIRSIDWITSSSDDGAAPKPAASRGTSLYRLVKGIVRDLPGQFGRVHVLSALQAQGHPEPNKLRLLRVLRKLEDRHIIRTTVPGRGRRPAVYAKGADQEETA